MTRRFRFSLSRKIVASFLVSILVVAAVAAAAARLRLPAFWVFVLTALLGGLLGFWLLARFLGPTRRSLEALLNAVQSFQDRDFSIRLAPGGNDELGDLVALYNQLGDLLRSERSTLLQKELMLDSVLQTSPIAIVLTNTRDRVVLSNRAASGLFASGRGKLQGSSFSEILERCPAEMGEAIRTESDALFTIESGAEPDVYHVSKRAFHLNRQRHTLYLVQRLTRELSRQEVDVWKKAIRVMSHELNNSLAPISSLVHSAQSIIDLPAQEERLALIYSSIGERIEHLETFLEGYACFARLPKPKKQSVEWPEFVESLHQLYAFELEGNLPGSPGFFDPGQIQQVLINLLKNAREADTATAVLEIESSGISGTRMRVMDRGKGMPEEVLRQALLPFYSTKPAGGGLGLPLCREIVEAHGGGLRIENREGGGLVVTCFLPPMGSQP